MTLKLQFDANQKFQIDAVEAVRQLFEGKERQAAAFTLGDEVVPNLSPGDELRKGWLYDNLIKVQEANGLQQAMTLEMDSSMELEWIGNNSCPYPSFTVEMETGTGKTYVALRTIHELRRMYGFGKFIIVVPSIAIYEGWIKNFQITRDHFRAIYGNETVNLIEYDGSRLSQLRAFAASTFVEILVITLDSFNSAKNVIFKPSEKLPGERLPYQYIQETRPILILDEPQNMESQKAHEALQTLHPLFALRYSATHRTFPNLVYRLTPFDAYRLSLVKKIQVYGVTERENFNKPFLALEKITLGTPMKATVRTYMEEKGHLREGEIVLKKNDDLRAKTNRYEHEGYIVSEINAGEKYIEFENGDRLVLNKSLGPSRPEIFREQIKQTIRQHMDVQQELQWKKIKVLSLFFIDRVANYTAADGLIRMIFDEEFNKAKKLYPFYAGMKAEEVRSAYFAKKKAKKGETEGEAVDTDSRNSDEREAEKAAFELIMRDKEKLLSFEEKTCFIFAHSALKEGWDNPNVFQICTLNQTVSEIKKRQEIGRGLRLAVNQEGERVMEDSVNILTVIANESYQSYAARLQEEYVEAGQAAPPKVTQAGKAKAKRNDEIFERTQAFKDFWAKLQKHTTYKISVDTPELVKTCVERISNRPNPQAVIVVEKGKFVVTEYNISLISAGAKTCKIKINTQDNQGNEDTHTHTLEVGADLARDLRDECLRGYKIVEIIEAGKNSKVLFGNNQILDMYAPIEFQSQLGQKPSERAQVAPTGNYPVFNLIDRAARETELTRPTLNQIFREISDMKKKAFFDNPEGFASLFITEINNTLADHVADRIEFEVKTEPIEWVYGLDDLFKEEMEFPQRELIEASAKSLYDKIQIDSDVEERFVNNRLKEDEQILFYFKFPALFKVNFPKVIGNYNPDWGIARYRDGKVLIELVRETKGSEETAGLQFPSEKRKITCAQKRFKAVGIDYRVVSDKTADWWKSAEEVGKQERMKLN